MITLKTFEHTPSLAELKVSYRRGRSKTAKRPLTPYRVSSPVSTEQYLRSVWDDDTMELREEFFLLCLNGSNEVLGWVKLHTGGLNQSMVDLRLVLGIAQLTASSAVIVAHNHPSGSLTPSPEDMALTRRLKEAGALIGLKVLDHLILTRDSYYSFCESSQL